MTRSKLQIRLFPKACSYPGCEREVFTKKLCRYHFNRTAEELARSRAKRGTIGGKYSSLKRKAVRYQRSMDISLDEYIELTVNRVCHYCARPLPPMGHGLDRLDGRKGYSTVNCVPCCTTCNSRKGLLEAAGLVYPETVEITHRLAGRPLEVRNRDGEHETKEEKRK